MEFLFSNLPPVRTNSQTFSETFYSLIPDATRLDIAVGYVTADSLAELKQTVAYNENIQTLNLLIGMHYLDSFTSLEHKAAVMLNDFLRENLRGEVRLVTPFRFHGKLYSYSNPNGAFAGIIGSNNLSSIVDSRTRIYEASAFFDEPGYAVKIREFIEKLSANSTDNIADCSVKIKNNNRLLDDHENVYEVSNEEKADVLSSLTDTSFEIPLTRNGSVPEKSNLNAFFGKGRLVREKRLVQPRHWYEAELIVPSEITTKLSYPQKDTSSAVFDVITDDNWKFTCKVSGDYSKNLRSEHDLKILGKWIKGRLENAGVLEVGQLVTAETFAQYGRDSFTFIKTSTPNLWYLDFGVNR